MVLDDVTFARQVMEGKVTNITVTITGDKRDVPADGTVVTIANAQAGLRVKRGPDWPANDSSDGNNGSGVLTTTQGCTAGAWKVQWDAAPRDTPKGYWCGGDKPMYALKYFGNQAPSFQWENVTQSAVILVTYTGAATDTLTLQGDAQHRVTKLCAWLPQNGLEQCGAPKDALTDKEHWVRTIFFTRSDVPF
jgi:hypothetical protein